MRRLGQVRDTKFDMNVSTKMLMVILVIVIFNCQTFMCYAVIIIFSKIFSLTLIWVGFLGVCFRWGVVKLPRLKLLRINLETSNLVHK